MTIKPRNIPKFQTGNNIWYNGIVDYDPTKYIPIYDTSRLVDGDVRDTKLTPWKSNISGYDQGRYQPTTGYGAFGINQGHFNYTKGVEGQDYYKRFGEDLLDSNGNFTPTGEAWARAVDALLPPGSRASFYDKDNKIRGTWTTQHNDAHGRSAKTYNTLRDYVNAVRNDQILGARHNVFLKKGKRYFYTDNEGNRHWVDPEVAKNYTISKDPIEQGWEGTTYWDDYELTGPGQATSGNNPDNPDNPNDPNRLPVSHRDGSYGFDWAKLSANLQQRLPGLMAAGRLAGNLWNNNRVYNEALKGIKPSLKQTYYTHRQVVGDEATKQAYYRRAAQGETKAARPVTSDADRQVAYQMEAKRIGDEMRAQGDLADNQEIRRTSDESNQHQWANTQRATEVANANIESLNRANAEKHNLLAQKQAANWTSWDNYLKGIEYRARQRQEEDRAYDDQIWALQHQHTLKTDPKLYELRKEASDAIDNNRPDAQEKLAKWKAYQNKLYIDMLNAQRERRRQRPIYFGEKGFKVKRVQKDDLLYKSTRDAVEHFRKMSKISSDALNRRPVKIEKLTSHPKNTRRYQQGGVAPFTVYTPVALGGETSTTSNPGITSVSSKSSSSTKKDKGDDTLDMIKELFKQALGKGLPSDMNSLYLSMSKFLAKSQAFGDSLSTEDIASAYLQQLSQLNTIQYAKSSFDKAKEVAIQNDALGEFAVTNTGRYVVQDGEGKISYKTLKEVGKDERFVTNEQLLNIRALSPEHAFDTNFADVVANGVGINKVIEYIKGTLIPTIKSSQTKSEEFVKASQGLKALENAPDGDYKHTISDKNNLKQAEYALNYITKSLPQNMRAVLELHANLNETTADELLATYISAQQERDYSEEYTPYTGKAAKDSNGNGNNSEEIKSNPIMQMIQQRGGVSRTWELITKDSNVSMSVNGTYYSQIPKVDNDVSIDKMLSESGFAGVLDSKQGITFGDQNISPDQLKDIMYSNSGGMIVTLPCKIVNGHKEINLGVRESYEQALQELESKGISNQSPDFYKELGKILKQKGLDSLIDSNGYPDKSKFCEFLVVEGYATSKVKGLNGQSQYVEKVKNPDSQLEQRIINALSTDSKKSNYSLDIDYWLWGDDVYRGTVFIPLTNNLNASVNAWGDQIKVDQSEDLENKFQNFNKASTAKSPNSNILYETK